MLEVDRHSVPLEAFLNTVLSCSATWSWHSNGRKEDGEGQSRYTFCSSNDLHCKIKNDNGLHWLSRAIGYVQPTDIYWTHLNGKVRPGRHSQNKDKALYDLPVLTLPENEKLKLESEQNIWYAQSPPKISTTWREDDTASFQSIVLPSER